MQFSHPPSTINLNRTYVASLHRDWNNDGRSFITASGTMHYALSFQTVRGFETAQIALTFWVVAQLTLLSRKPDISGEC